MTSDAQIKFDRAAKRLEREIAKFAASAEGVYGDCKTYRALRRALDRLGDLVRYLEPADCSAANARYDALFQARIAAGEASQALRVAERNAEIQALDEQIAEKRRANYCGFSHELRTAGVGFGRR